MNYLTHNALWWIAIICPIGMFEEWVTDAGWNDEFADGPLDAPVP